MRPKPLAQTLMESPRKTSTHPQKQLQPVSSQTELEALSGRVGVAQWCLRRALRSLSRGNSERVRQHVVSALEALDHD